MATRTTPERVPGKPAPTARIRPWSTSGLPPLTRAHLLVQRGAGVAAPLAAALPGLEVRLGDVLGHPVRVVASLSDAAVVPEAGLARYATWAVLECAGGAAGRVAVELDALSTGVLLHLAAGAPARTGLLVRWSRAEQAALSWLWLEALAALGASPGLRGLLAPTLVALHCERSRALEDLARRVRHLSIRFTAVLGPHELSGRLLVPGPLVESAARRTGAAATAATAAAPSLPAVVAAARVPAVLRGGRARLGATELTALRPGDVIVFDGLAWGGSAPCGEARLRSPSFELAGELGPEGLRLHRATQHLPQREEDMPNPDVPFAPLPVEVEVELTRLSIPVAELATLKPGAVLPLHLGPAAAVTLRVGDRAIARAELVDVDGEVGARIVSLAGGR